ncbi:hypothetical protein ACFL4O_02000 [bacterium]
MLWRIKNFLEENSVVLIAATLVVTVAGIVGIGAMFLIDNEVRQTVKAKRYDEVLHIAEAGINKAIQQIKLLGSTYTGETDTPLNDGVFIVRVSTISEAVYQIVGTGYIPDRIQSKFIRQVKCIFEAQTAQVQDDIFSYAVAAGTYLSLSLIQMLQFFLPTFVYQQY